MKREKPKRNNILLVAITRLGDMLQASPTILGLKREYPEAKLTVAIERNFARICDGIPGIDEVYEIDLSVVVQCLAREKDGVVDAYKYITKVVDDLRAKDFDFCLNMSSSGYTALLLRMLDIKDMRGWVSDDEGHRLILDPWAMLFSAFVYHSNRDYNSINLVDIFRSSAGVTEHPNRLMYEVPKQAKSFPDAFLTEHHLEGSGPLICIQAGASQEKRQWSPARFAHTARLLIEQLGARLVFTGSGSEQRIIDRIFSIYSHPRMISAAGKTDLAQLAALLERADVLVTGDTGTMHLSVAVGTPVVANFLASALCFETGPYGPGNLVVQPLITCNPCNPNLACSKPECHDQVSPELMVYLTKLRLEHTDDSLLEVQIPRAMADPEQAAVYVTTFDADRYLDFRPLNGLAPRNGFPAEYYQAARASYRALWKNEFLGLPLPEGLPQGALSAVSGLRDAVYQAGQGRALVAQLQNLIRDAGSEPRKLGEVNTAIQTTDRCIEDVGLSNSVLGAVIRMFIMERENLRGDDPLFLAEATKQLYDILSSRCEKFGKLFAHYGGVPAVNEVGARGA